MQDFLVHHSDLGGPDGSAIKTGLAWYYLLAAMLNAAAAAYLSYMEIVSEGGSRAGLRPKTRKLPDWLFLSFCGLYGLALATLVGRYPLARLFLGGTEINHALTEIMRAAYWMCALANFLVAVVACADAAQFGEARSGHNDAPESERPSRIPVPSLDDHVPAFGLGKPMNRTLWTLVWGIVAAIFQVMGIVYVLDGEYGLPPFVRDAIDAVSGPTTFFIGATLAFVAMYVFRKTIANGILAWGIVDLALLFLGLSMTDYDFRQIVTKPDNVPIVGLMVLVAYFTWLSLRRAVINDARMAAGLPNLEELEPEKTFVWPDLVYTELIAMVAQTIFLVVWAIVLKAPLEEPASATSAPNPSKAPWYFLGLQEMLVYFDPWMAGVVLPTLIIVGLMAIPYIDTNKQGNGYYTIAQRKFAYLTFQFGYLVLWVVLILLGTFLRGPNWNFFGPYEFWDLHKLIPLNNVNLSDIVWLQVLKIPLPDWVLIREAPGLLLTLAYIVLVPLALRRYVPMFRRYAKESGEIRYWVLAILLLFMASLPIKMVLRWTLNLKYLVAIREYFFNI